ncbi:hypothetical protein KO500_02665 [Cellulophaga baltica]|uniref:hypothetical protein n=1 Tax=Cellulophaga TaxID=104264 RepID=UPI001C06973D|nr:MULTISPECIES: hypothetical protein [Cellulophaga]MBU2995313.1 hypothetical protein [Cellulophaga baltica]MDO6766708.1 hypothetical protein [Cellulophaga sp. 1_MG-2023]
MKNLIKIAYRIVLFILLTILTQIGGVVYLASLIIIKQWNKKLRFKTLIVFISLYLFSTLILVPLVAPLFGREKVKHSKKINPANYMTVLLNRNYVTPELNDLLRATIKELNGTAIEIHYLDASFPFINKFPLLPHLSHNDGKKIDLSLIYETKNGDVSNKQKSNSGYGLFENPKQGEYNQIDKCIGNGFIQYDFSKYLTLGEINKELVFSENGTKELIENILKSSDLGKLFIEPHLKNRMQLNNNKIRYHGCSAVRHDDHIHIQLK